MQSIDIKRYFNRNVIRFLYGYALLIALLFGASQSWGESLLEEIPPPIKSQLPAPQIEADVWLLADFESGWILGSANAETRIEPASLTKLMTGYLVFDALSRGEIKMEDQVYISEKAWKTSGSRMFVRVNTQVAIEQLLKGLIIQSGNDAAVALAEHLGGSEAGFAIRMNQMAAQLGMDNTHFVNSNGLPHPQHYSSALDMTILTLSLIRRFPQYYRLYSHKEYTYNDITQQNRNTLLWRDPSIDGIKTGYTSKAGYCLIGTAERDGMRLIATVTGSQSAKSRAEQVYELLQYGYAAYEGMVVYRPGGEVKSLPLWMGQQPTAQVGVRRNLGVVYPRGSRDKLSGALNLPDSLVAPLQAGQSVGDITLKFDGNPIRTASLHIAEDYPSGEWWSRLLDSVKRLFY